MTETLGDILHGLAGSFSKDHAIAQLAAALPAGLGAAGLDALGRRANSPTDATGPEAGDIAAALSRLPTADAATRAEILQALSPRLTGAALAQLKAEAQAITGVSSAGKSQARALDALRAHFEGLERARRTTPSA